MVSLYRLNLDYIIILIKSLNRYHFHVFSFFFSHVWRPSICMSLTTFLALHLFHVKELSMDTIYIFVYECKFGIHVLYVYVCMYVNIIFPLLLVQHYIISWLTCILSFLSSLSIFSPITSVLDT